MHDERCDRPAKNPSSRLWHGNGFGQDARITPVGQDEIELLGAHVEIFRTAKSPQQRYIAYPAGVVVSGGAPIGQDEVQITRATK